jgi:hypothetical protein
MCAARAAASVGDLVLVHQDSFNRVECKPFNEMIHCVWIMLIMLTPGHSPIYLATLFPLTPQLNSHQETEVGRDDLG